MSIANSSAALGIGWPGWYKPSEKEPLDYTSFVGRCSENQVRYNSNIYGIWTVGIPENSRNKIIAVKLLEYIMNPDVQKSTIPSGGVPCRYSSLSDPKVLAKYPQYEAVLSALENGIYRPVMEEWTQFYTVLGNELKMIFDGRLSIEEGLEEAQEKLENLLK